MLKKLPNLTGLKLYDLPDLTIDRNEIFDLFSFNGLIKFSFTSLYNCNQLLIEIAKSLNVVELEIHACMDEHTFDIIKSFGNLERLSLTRMNGKTYGQSSFVGVPENVVLPPQLQCIKFGGIEISCNCFLSIVKNLKILTEFDIADGYIVDGVGKLLHEIYAVKAS